MAETPQEYTKRIMSTLQAANPITVQANAAKKIERLMKGASTARLRKRPRASTNMHHRGGDRRPSGGHLDRRGLAHAPHPWRARHAASTFRSRRLGRGDALRKTRRPQIPGGVSCAVREANLAFAEISIAPNNGSTSAFMPNAAQESIRHIVSLRRRPRYQPSQADRAHSQTR